jgi:hypothetical protein
MITPQTRFAPDKCLTKNGMYRVGHCLRHRAGTERTKDYSDGPAMAALPIFSTIISLKKFSKII